MRNETFCPNTIINNKVLPCLTDTSLYIYICFKHFGMANIKQNVDPLLFQTGNKKERVFLSYVS